MKNKQFYTATKLIPKSYGKEGITWEEGDKVEINFDKVHLVLHRRLSNFPNAGKVYIGNEMITIADIRDLDLEPC